MLHGGRGARLPVRAARVGAELPPQPLERRVAVALVRRYHVDEAADRVRAVEQRRRPADDLDALGPVRVYRDPVVGRRAGEVAGAHAVFENQHPVAVEAPDYRPVRGRSETADRDARLVPQHFADGVAAPRREVERIEGGDGVERLQRGFRPAGRGGDAQLLMEHRQFQHEVRRRGLAGGDGDRPAAGREMFALGEELVGAGRDAVDGVPALLVGQAHRARADHHDHRAVHRPAVLRQRDPAADGARLLRPDRRGQDGGRRQDGREAYRCQSAVHRILSLVCVYTYLLREPLPVPVGRPFTAGATISRRARAQAHATAAGPAGACATPSTAAADNELRTDDESWPASCQTVVEPRAAPRPKGASERRRRRRTANVDPTKRKNGAY